MNSYYQPFLFSNRLIVGRTLVADSHDESHDGLYLFNSVIST